MTNLKKKMISEMFNRIKKGPASADMRIESKKGNKEIWAWHWYRSKKYCVQFSDYENKKHTLIGEFTCWSDVFKFIADYVLENDF